jgi:hypothetical protein
MANAEYMRELRAERRKLPVPESIHGTEVAYVNWGCRCNDCRQEATRIKKERPLRRRGSVVWTQQLGRK